MKSQERKSLQGKLDNYKLFAPSDSEDEREGRRVQDKVAARREASTVSVRSHTSVSHSWYDEGERLLKSTCHGGPAVRVIVRACRGCRVPTD